MVVLKAISYKLKARAGFTLIELIVVISITAILSVFAIVYSKTGQRQVLLYVEEQKIVAMIQKAKSLTLTTYNNTSVSQPKTCGYGLQINYAAGTYSLFSYLPPVGPPPPVCDAITSVDPSKIDNSSGAQKTLASYTNIPLPSGLQLNSAPSDHATYILFVAPYPRTIVSSDPAGVASINPVKVYLQTVPNQASVQITVNSAGQVDF